MEYEINLLDYWKVIVKWKRDVAVIVLAVTIAAVVTSLLLPKAYRAEVKIMPVGGQSIGGIGTGLSRLGLDTLLGGAGMGGGSSMPLILFLRSRSLAEKIVERHDLREILFPESLREGRRGKIGEAMPVDEVAEALLSRMQFENNSAEQVLVISAEMGEPQLAADMANLYVKELDQYLVDNAVTVARRNRIFVGGQLERNKAEILEAGRDLAAFYASNRISSVASTVDVAVGEEGRGGLLGERGEEIRNPRTLGHAPPGDSGIPGVPTASAEIRRKTDDLQKQVSEVRARIETAKVVKDVPQQVYLQYLTLQGDLLGQVNSLLTQQYEMAKIDENRESLSFHVIDWARAPKTRSRPMRRRIVTLSFLAAGFFAVFYAFVREYLEKLRRQHQLQG